MRQDFREVPNGRESFGVDALTGFRCDAGNGRGGAGPPGMGAGEMGSAPPVLSHSD